MWRVSSLTFLPHVITCSDRMTGCDVCRVLPSYPMWLHVVTEWQDVTCVESYPMWLVTVCDVCRVLPSILQVIDGQKSPCCCELKAAILISYTELDLKSMIIYFVMLCHILNKLAPEIYCTGIFVKGIFLLILHNNQPKMSKNQMP